MKIMLLDDDPLVLRNLSFLLNEEGNTTYAFSDPNEGIEAYRRGDFDIVITDYQMPGMNGIEVLKALRRYDPDAYVVLLTGDADLERAMQAVNNGARGFLVKPLNVAAFLNSLKTIERELDRSQRLVRGL